MKRNSVLKVVFAVVLAAPFVSCMLIPYFSPEPVEVTTTTTTTISGGTNITPSGTPVHVFGTMPVYGYQGILNSSSITKWSIYAANVRLDFPSNQVIIADSCFNCRGSFFANPGDFTYLDIRITNMSSTNGNTDYKILSTGDFDYEVFLRHGPGTYRVRLYLKCATNSYIYGAAEFYVTNISPSNLVYLMPSPSVQSFDPGIAGTAAALTNGCATDRDKVIAIHDWIVKHLYYDFADSLTNNDAYEAYYLGRAVCQGYSCLGAAMFRSIGLPAKYVRGYSRASTSDPWSTEINHGWNEVYYNGKWNIMDITWDDPIVGGHSDYPDGSNLETTWFEPDLDFFNTRHTNWYAADFRSIEVEKLPQY